MSTSSKTVEGISFGPFFLDTAGRRLLQDGRRISISPIELKLLETLLRNRDRVLTGDELRVLVWADDPSSGIAPAGDVNALYVAIRKLRKTLGSHGKWIVNIPKVGYTISEEVKVDVGDEVIHVTADDDHPFVGRRAELEKLKDLLARTRLITLTGPPGIGKSRLASMLAGIVAMNYSDGVFPVNLVPIENENLVPSAVLRVLGLTEQADRSVTEVVSDHLKDKRALVILDNCEHLVEACSQLVDYLLRSAPKLQIIVASQEPLLLAAESVMHVPPLSVPDPGSSNGSNAYEAVELFTALAKRHGFDFAAEKKDVALVGELCRRLEGIPLAIELAAVQIGAYTVEQIIEVMSDRFRLLRRRGGEDIRHKTLEGAIDWSYSLLREEERTFLRRLSIFSGGWTSDTAREICSGAGVETDDSPHLLAQLVRRSLIQLTGVRGDHRYQMLETIRQFGRTRLLESGEKESVIVRHDQYFLQLAENSFEAGVRGDWLAQLKTEYDNVRSVLKRSTRPGGDVETALRICGALAKFWFNYGHLREARWWTKQALDANKDGRFPEATARALRTAGFFFGQTSESAEDSQLGKAYFEQSVAIWRELGDENEEAFTLSHYSYLLNRLGLADQAREAANRSLEICTAAGDHANIARSMNNIAVNLLDTGKPAEAKPIFESALSEARIADDRYLEAVCLHNLGEVAVQMGELENADVNLADSVELFRAIGNRPLFGRTLLLQGEIASLKDETASAIDLSKEALAEFRDIEDIEGIASALEVLASIYAKCGLEPTLAVTLFAAARNLRKTTSLKPGPARIHLIDNVIKRAVREAGSAAAKSAEDRGRTMTLAVVIDLALSVSMIGE